MTDREPLSRIKCRDVDGKEAVVIVYRLGPQISLLITTREGGDVEVVLGSDAATTLANALLDSTRKAGNDDPV